MDNDSPIPHTLRAALKEWAVTVRALREGRQVFLLRKGGLLDAGGEFSLESRRVLLFPTYLHEDEQSEALQPCYRQWLKEENAQKPKGETGILRCWAEITDAVPVTNPGALYTTAMQHIHSDSFLHYRILHDPARTLFACFLRVYELPAPVEIRMEPNYYGCKSWITLSEDISLEDSKPAVSEHTYNERVRVLRQYLTQIPPEQRESS